MRTSNKSSPVWRRIVATFMLVTMLMTSMAVTAIAAPVGATVVDLTVAGGGSCEARAAKHNATRPYLKDNIL